MTAGPSLEEGGVQKDHEGWWAGRSGWSQVRLDVIFEQFNGVMKLEDFSGGVGHYQRRVCRRGACQRGKRLANGMGRDEKGMGLRFLWMMDDV